MAKRRSHTGSSRAHNVPKAVSSAYERKQTHVSAGYRVKGRSTKELLDIDIKDFNQLTESDLRKATSILASAANKRYKRFQARGTDTPATRQLEQSGGKLSVKGKDLNQLRAEFMRAKQFLEAQTSTRRGWEQVQKSTIDALKKRGIEITKDQLDTFWKAYEDLKDISPDVANKSLKYDVMRNISERMEQGERDPEVIASEMRDEISRIYEERESSYASGGVSSFFEL